MTADLALRAAAPADIPRLEALIAASARGLGTGHYSAAQTEAAVAHIFGVDSELVDDGTYLVAEAARDLAGCGGWSRRRTLFGGDRYQARAPGWLDPATEPAKIRAFFVAPEWARRGVASQLLAACEAAAAAAGFTATELMATLPGVPFYAAHGYIAAERLQLDVGGVSVDFVPMRKALAA